MVNGSIVGFAGTVTVGASGTVANVTEFDLTRANDVQEITTFVSAGNKEFAKGLDSWEASVKGNFSTVAAIPTFGSTLAAVTFDVTGAGISFVGAGIFSDINIDCTVGQVVKFTATFRGSGTLT